VSWWQIALITFVPVVILLLVGAMVYTRTQIQKRKLHKNHESIEVVQEPMERPITPELPKEMAPLAPELLAEIEENYRIASDPRTGELVLFPTSLWNNNKQQVSDSPADLREDLVQAYIDIGLANNIVWMSTELNFRSQNLDDQYVKLCAKIAARLDRIMPLLKGSPAK